jgi:acyl-coenzyme A synthetase/AMP-(fatty) acid ligase
MQQTHWLIDSFVQIGDNNAIITDDKVYSYKNLYDKILELKALLQTNKIQKGDVVAIVSDYSFESIALLLALTENKNIIVPISSKVQASIDEKIATADCDKVVYIENGVLNIIHNEMTNKHKMIRKLQDISHSGLILFSSGSTGKPKAMIHDLDNLINTYKDKKKKSMNMLLFLMFDHIGGLNTLFNILSIGSTMIIPNSREVDEICSLIEKYKISILPSSPTFLNLILMSNSHTKYDMN